MAEDANELLDYEDYERDERQPAGAAADNKRDAVKVVHRTCAGRAPGVR